MKMESRDLRMSMTPRSVSNLALRRLACTVSANAKLIRRSLGQCWPSHPAA